MSSTTHDQFDYTYDYAGNRLTRNIDLAIYATNNFDQGYTYDGLQRLKNSQRGTLSSGSITSRNFEQDWTLPQRYLTSVLAKIGSTPAEELVQFLPDV